ncbi:MAG: biotin/lipoyl-containing protein [Desulfopila sp.]
MRTFRVVVNGSEYQVEIEELGTTASVPAAPAARPVQGGAHPLPATAPAPPDQARPTADKKAAPGAIRAPMPGTVLKIGVAKGDRVVKGQMLLVLEAMKMENDIQAPHDGLVEEVLIGQGASVNAGDVLITLG